MTFSSFVPGTTYPDALSAVRLFAGHPGTNGQPLVIIGPSGVGKSHLMHAIAADVRERRAGAVSYQTASELIDRYVDHLSERPKVPFSPVEEGTTWWLIDHLEELVGKSQTRRDLCAMFEQAMQNGTAVVFSINSSLCNEGFVRDMLDRFPDAQAVRLPLPDTDTRRALVRAAAKSLSLPLDEEAVSRIVAVTKTAPEIYGIVATLHNRCATKGITPSASLLSEVIALNHAV